MMDILIGFVIGFAIPFMMFVIVGSRYVDAVREGTEFKLKYRRQLTIINEFLQELSSRATKTINDYEKSKSQHNPMEQAFVSGRAEAFRDITEIAIEKFNHE